MKQKQYQKLDDTIKRCKICFSEFKATNANCKYCEYCRKMRAIVAKRNWELRNGKIKPSGICPRCNTVFKTTKENQHYCSLNCSRKTAKINRLKKRLAKLQREIQELYLD